MGRTATKTQEPVTDVVLNPRLWPRLKRHRMHSS